MRNKHVMTLALAALLATGCFAQAFAAEPAPTAAEKSQSPVIRMKDWKDSPAESKYAFLAGITSMVELERTWQAPKPMSLDRSLSAAWTTGLSGVSFAEMVKELDAYAVEKPENLNTSVLEVLWIKFVQPKLTDAQRKQVRNAYYGRNIKR